jgi:hypothetical protein
VPTSRSSYQCRNPVFETSRLCVLVSYEGRTYLKGRDIKYTVISLSIAQVVSPELMLGD